MASLGAPPVPKADNTTLVFVIAKVCYSASALVDIQVFSSGLTTQQTPVRSVVRGVASKLRSSAGTRPLFHALAGMQVLAQMLIYFEVLARICSTSTTWQAPARSLLYFAQQLSRHELDSPVLADSQVLAQVLLRLDSPADISSLCCASRGMLAALTADHLMLAQWLWTYKSEDAAMCLAARKGGSDVMVALLQRFGSPGTRKYQGKYRQKVPGLDSERELKEEHSETYPINRHTRIGLPGIPKELKSPAMSPMIDTVPEGLTAIELAAKYGHSQVVANLLQRAEVRADVEAVVGALFLAAQFDQVECLAVLLSPLSPVGANSRSDPHKGFDVAQGSTALHKAAYAGHVQAVRLLLSKGAEVNSMDNLQCTPLHLACLGLCGTKREERAEVVRLMSGVLASCNAACALDSYDAAGSTPLHYAVREGLHECCEALLSAGSQALQMPVEGTGGYPGDDWRRRHCRLSDISLQVAGSTPMDLCMDRLQWVSTADLPCERYDALVVTRDVLLRWAPVSGLCPGERRPYRRR
ncbi:ankyrin repeat-containing domain protein [Dunaliella salina]|uniref:Ankyrin repeat-containing domain protein n=1 Tax=Dunaliella salina TaxID=3046 RepID=A0ABQ7GM30_DUNSA|nr:ankyrin repeat-containing domain protein [Dunaliella salina]|eukprot:KAF5835667.1 ankyrin repeat-containing domain protein [Dunaliella salina]